MDRSIAIAIAMVMMAIATGVDANTNNKSPPPHPYKRRIPKPAHNPSKLMSGPDGEYILPTGIRPGYAYDEKSSLIKLYRSVAPQHATIRKAPVQTDSNGNLMQTDSCRFNPPTRRWDVSANPKIVVHINHRDSRCHSGELMNVFNEALAIWKAVPNTKLPDVELVEDLDLVPSSYHATRPKSNGRNEITFVHSHATLHQNKGAVPGIGYVWCTDDKRHTIREVDYVFDVSMHSWATHPKQLGDANQWEAPNSHQLDLRSAAVNFWGQFFGLGFGDDYDHSMCSFTRNGEQHQTSLHCADERAIASIYPL